MAAQLKAISFVEPLRSDSSLSRLRFTVLNSHVEHFPGVGLFLVRFFVVRHMHLIAGLHATQISYTGTADLSPIWRDGIQRYVKKWISCRRRRLK